MNKTQTMVPFPAKNSQIHNSCNGTSQFNFSKLDLNTDEIISFIIQESADERLNTARRFGFL